MQFRIQLSNSHTLTLERDGTGNVLITVCNEHSAEGIPIASGVERNKDFSTMAAILGD